jgi:hypothetical protein
MLEISLSASKGNREEIKRENNKGVNLIKVQYIHG